MPIECDVLEGRPSPIKTCPKCGADFKPFMRGQVQRWPRKWLIGPWRPYCALICSECKEIVGHE
jgi:ribosomal protein L34E